MTLGVGDSLSLTFFAQSKGDGLVKSKIVFKYGDGTDYTQYTGSETLTSADITKAKANFKLLTASGKVNLDTVSLILTSAGGGTPTEEPTVEATPTETETPSARLNGSK